MGERLNELRSQIAAEGGLWDGGRTHDFYRLVGFDCTLGRARQNLKMVAERWPSLLVPVEGKRHTYQAAGRKPIVTLHVLTVDLDRAPLDCCDNDPVHAWVVVTGWSGRRAYLVQGTQFAEAAGCAPEELTGKHFIAELDLYNPPSAEPEPGEQIEFPGLKLAPEIPKEWLEK